MLTLHFSTISIKQKRFLHVVYYVVQLLDLNEIRILKLSKKREEILDSSIIIVWCLYPLQAISHLQLPQDIHSLCNVGLVDRDIDQTMQQRKKKKTHYISRNLTTKISCSTLPRLVQTKSQYIQFMLVIFKHV